MAAKAKTKKKKGKAGNADAKAKALAALQQLEAAKTQVKVKRHRSGANGQTQPAQAAPTGDPEPEPAAEAEAPVAAEGKAPASAPQPAAKEESSGSSGATVATAEPEEAASQQEAPQVPTEAEPAAEEAAQEEPAEAPAAHAPAEEPTEEAPVEAPAGAPAAEAPAETPTAPVDEKPARPRSKLQNAFAALADIGASAEPRRTAPEQRQPATASGMDDMMAAFMAPPPAAGTASELEDAASAFLAEAPPKVTPAKQEEKDIGAVTPSPVSEDGEDVDEDEDEEERDDDDDDDEAVPIARRRGENDLVSFEMETGGLEGMVSVGLKEVAVRFGGRLVIQDASWVVRTGDRLALVGENGCGKTTQLKVLTGEIKPDAGEVVTNRPDIRIAVLTQSFVDELDPSRSLEEELLAAVPKESQVLKELAEIQKQIEGADEGSEEAMELIERLTALQVKAEELRAYDLDGRMNSIMAKVGFIEGDLQQQVGSFSGGWKVRIGLSKIFMTAPDVLLLDEPTNHLDLESVEWLESFLQKQNLPIVLVSHDREFMDRVCNRTVETVEGMTYTYKGGYSEYIKQREEKMENWRKKYALQEKQVKEMQDFIKVNRGKQMMANARNKKIAELEKWRTSDKWLDPPPRYTRPIKFNFPEPPRARRGTLRVNTIAEMQDVSHGYGDGADSLLLKQANFAVRSGEKIGIVGRNGVGKSTLLRLLMGEEKPSQEEGYIMPADMEKARFFTQHQADLLPLDLTAYEVVKEANEILMDETELLEIMKKFRFKGDRLHVKCVDLSGGEKARLAIVRMMLAPSQLLIFDEPTNHLDVPMKETLEYSLREFDGAVVVVSHDRWFLSQTCENIVEIKEGQVERYDGDYRHYIDRNPEIKRKVEQHYTRNSRGIASVPYSGAERKKRERGGLKKNWKKRQAQEKKEMINAVFGGGRGGGGRRRR